MLPSLPGDVLLGMSEQGALDITSPSTLMATASKCLKEAVTARDPLDVNVELVGAAGLSVPTLLRLTLMGSMEREEDQEESMDSESDDDIPE